MRKADKHIIIKITGQGVFYNDTECIAWEHTNFPAKDKFRFNERLDIFWKARLVSYDKVQSALKVEVVDYEADDEQATFISQKAKFPFQKVWFIAPLKWEELIQIMNYYEPQYFDTISDYDKKAKAQAPKAISLNPADFAEPVPVIKTQQTNIHFKYPLKDTRFRMGYIELQKKIKGFPKKVTIHLKNDNIIPEFDHVKPFFAKALGKRKIEVSGYMEIDEKGAIAVRCQSKEVNQINEELISAVKRLQLKKSIFSPQVVTIDKSLFTPEEYFEGLEEEHLGNSLRQSDKDLLEEMLQFEEIRNRSQLLYLSGKLQSPNTGLRFTLSPQFGFLFYVEGEEMDHFIWELLNTNATYIWSIDKKDFSLEDKFKQVERQVNFIKDHGRRLYLRSEKPTDLTFSKINHENSKAGVIDGFPKWKKRVNEKLV